MNCGDCRDEESRETLGKRTRFHVCRCLVVALYQGKSYRGETWAYCMPDEYADPPSRDPVIGEWYWTEGNQGCDCNRVDMLGLTPEVAPDLYHVKGSFYSDGSGPVEETHVRCGHKILIQSITPMTCTLVKPLVLNESEDGQW